VITGDVRSKIDRLWDAFWSGGISNPLEAIEQITYLMFLRRLDDQRWRELVAKDPKTRFATMSTEVFPWLRNLGGEGSTYARHMRDARFTIPTPNLLGKAVDILRELPADTADGVRAGEQDTKGDLYEYMLSKIATAGQNGQFRTPRHIIELMVAMTDPRPDDEICDPACGTAGFLVESARHVGRKYSTALVGNERHQQHYRHDMFHGFDFDRTMLRIGSMNMLQHGVADPDIRYRDSLSEGSGDDEGRYSLILANPPFAGSLDYETTAKDLQAVVKTKKTELLFLALFLRLLRDGGRAAVIVPDGVLFGSTNAHKGLRKTLVDSHRLDAVVKLPSGVFRPYAGVSTAILFFTKTGKADSTDFVWFYEVTADGWSLDDRRGALLPESKLGPAPGAAPTEAEHAKNNLPDVLTRWHERRDASERRRARTEQSFCVPVEEIRSQGYDLSLNRYKEVVHEEVEYRDPPEILADLEQIEAEIQAGMSELKRALG
jgi:type I restriction enzyme M protein